MDPTELMEQTRDALTVKRVFGEPYERNGVTIVPAAACVRPLVRLAMVI